MENVNQDYPFKDQLPETCIAKIEAELQLLPRDMPDLLKYAFSKINETDFENELRARRKHSRSHGSLHAAVNVIPMGKLEKQFNAISAEFYTLAGKKELSKEYYMQDVRKTYSVMLLTGIKEKYEDFILHAKSYTQQDRAYQLQTEAKYINEDLKRLDDCFHAPLKALLLDAKTIIVIERFINHNFDATLVNTGFNYLREALSEESEVSKNDIVSSGRKKPSLPQIALYHFIIGSTLNDTKAIAVCETNKWSRNSSKTLMKYYRGFANADNIYFASPTNKAERNKKKKDFETACSLGANEGEKSILEKALAQYLKEYNKVS